MNIHADVTCERATPLEKHHFFGYYDTSPWDPSGRFLLTLETDFMDRPPSGNEPAGILRIEPENGFRCVRIAETLAWNWQQGSLLQWLPASDGPAMFVHNDLRNGCLVAVVRSLDGREIRVLPRPVYDISPDGLSALSLNFSRLARTRPGYGYAGIPDGTASALIPEDDGVWLMDMASGNSRLIFSVRDILNRFPWPGNSGFEHWFNHLLFAPDGQRFVFIHRCRRPAQITVAGKMAAHQPRMTLTRLARRIAGAGYRRVFGRRFGGFRSRLFSADLDGSSVRCLLAEGKVSHFFWKDPGKLLAWAENRPVGERYWLIEDATGTSIPIGEEDLREDGHCSFSPDGQWLLTDTYPDDANVCTLMLYDIRRNRRIDLGRFASAPDLRGEIRCDLHPRWNRDGRCICFDSVHEGSRQVYVMNVTSLFTA